MKIHFSFFGPVLTALYLAMNFYIVSRLLRYFRPGRGAARALTAFFIVLALAFPTAHSLEAVAGGVFGRAWLWFGFFWLGASFILFYTLLIFDLAFTGLKAAGLKLPTRPCALAALAFATGLIGFAIKGGADEPRVKHIEAALSGLPSRLDGFKIIQVSDLHLGRLTGPDKLRRLAAQINSLEPDLVVLTGDFSERRENMPDDACGILKSLRARYGLAAALGNHDLFAGKDKAADFFSRCGIRVLRGNVYEPAPGLLVGGVDDLKRSPLSPADAALLAKALFRPGAAAVLLSHQPQGWEAVMNGAPGLVLSGHTHAGQIFPFNLIERPFFKYFYGLYKDRETLLYVTSGAGTWGPPLRLFAPSELPLITLRPAGTK